jgi:hypothetical protein
MTRINNVNRIFSPINSNFSPINSNFFSKRKRRTPFGILPVDHPIFSFNQRSIALAAGMYVHSKTPYHLFQIFQSVY